MAQFIKILNQNDELNVMDHHHHNHQTAQFFNVNPNPERQQQIQYIVTDNNTQFQPQLVITTNQIMELNNSPQQQQQPQQQIQRVVINQSPNNNYQTTNNSPQQQQQQYTSIVQQQGTDSMNNHQTVQQLYYMDANNQPENVQATVIEQTNNQPLQTPPQQQPQQIILNHQLGQIGSNLNLCNRITIPGVQRRMGQVRAPMRPVNISAAPRMNSPRPQMRNQLGTFAVRAPTSIQQLSLRALQQAQRKSPVPEETLPSSSSSVELEDHDAAMNSIPGQISGRGQIFGRQPAKVPILSRLPARRVTISTNQHHQLPQQVEALTQRSRPVLVPYSIEDDIKESKNFTRVSSRPQVRLKPDVTVSPQNLEKFHQEPSIQLPESQRENVKIIPIINQSTANSVGYSNNNSSSEQQKILDNHQVLLQLAAQKSSTPPQDLAAMNSLQLTQQQQPNNNNSPPKSNRGNQLNYIITPPNQNSRPQQALPPCISPTQMQHILENFTAEEYSDSIRMLVLLENGEKRLITFTLSKEACSIQEILELVQVPFTPETNIQISEINTNGVKYVVTVGNVPKCDYELGEDEKFLLDSSQEINKIEESSTTNDVSSSKSEKINDSPPKKEVVPTPPPRPPTPPKLIPGKLAVCFACGYTGEDFNKCSRCQRKLPVDVKSIDANSSVTVKKAAFKAAAAAVNKQLSISPSSSSSGKSSLSDTSVNLVTTTRAELVAKHPTVRRRIGRAVKQAENESVIISSDEEEPEPKSTKTVSEQILNKLGASISISRVTKEPSISEIKRHVRKEETESPPPAIEMYLKCRTVRIGSYRFAPISEVYFDSKCIRIIAPVLDKTEIKTIRIDRCDIVKILICYNKALPVIFYYLNAETAPLIREMLSLSKEKGIYFDPLDEKDDSYRKITLLPEDPIDDVRFNFDKLYSSNAIDELTLKEANEILIKACPKDMNILNNGSLREIEHLLMYPKEGPGRLSINTEDFVCLAVDQFLNDKIIDFYLMYLWENLPKEQREKIHIFSTFFYKRLTTKATKAAKKSHPYETDVSLSAAEKRHWRVKNWTKRTNLFEKDFIVVPINENAHWFLAIICFPSLKGPQTFDGKPFNAVVKPKKVKPKIGPELKKEKVIPCDDPISDKDEAESEDSDMESDVSEESTSATSVAAEIAAEATVATPKIPSITKVKASDRPPIKQPCVLIFDSLAGPSRCRVVATLRDYLTVEYKVKTGVERVFNRDNIKGASCKVPQQTNFTDCGLYLLQYVEQFFKNPLKDYSIPVKDIQNWFDEIIVTKKREDISNLIKDLMIQDGHDINVLPNIALPTVNGKLIERRMETEEENGEDEQEDMFTDIEDSEIMDESAEINPIEKKSAVVIENNDNDKNEDNLDSCGGEMRSQNQNTPPKPSRSMGGEDSDELMANVTPASPLKPTLRELPAKSTTNKDTLNYLKAKRIVRHNKPHTEEPDMKKSKLTTSEF